MSYNPKGFANISFDCMAAQSGFGSWKRLRENYCKDELKELRRLL